MNNLTLGAGLIATALFATACNGAETGSSGVTAASGTGSGGVSSSGPLQGNTGSDAPDPRQTCNADAVQWAIGRPATEEVVERAKRESGAKVVRVLPPGLSVTQEFMYGRLNINVDPLNVIQTVSCW